MIHYFFIGKTFEGPHLDDMVSTTDEDETTILYCLEDTSNQNINLGYLVMLFYKSSEQKSNVMKYVFEEWKEFSNTEISLELIETKLSNFSSDFRVIFRSLEAESLGFKTPFIAYDHSSLESYKSAIELIREAALA